MPNEVTLKGVDQHLRPLKDSNGVATSIEATMQGNGARVTGALEVTGDLEVKGDVLTTVIAGQIIGYTDIGMDEATATYDLTTSYVVPTDEFGVSFICPPSRCVEIMMQVRFYTGSTGSGDLYAGLSTANATVGYNTLGDFYEEELRDQGGRHGLEVIQNRWTVIQLIAGRSYNFFVGFKSTSTSGSPQVQWGGNATDEAPDFILKATALPPRQTITT